MSRSGVALERALFFACAIASVVPLFLVRVLPFTDVPEHVAAIASLAHFRDPSWNEPETYDLALATSQSPLFHAAGALLAKITGADLAVRLLLAGSGIALPFSLAALLRASGRNPRLALLGSALFWCRPLVVGLAPFVVALPVTLYALSEVLRAANDSARRPPSFLLAGLGVTVAALHFEAFALFAASGIVIAAVAAAFHRPSESDGIGRGLVFLRGSAFLLPSIVLTALRLGHAAEPSAHVSFVPKKVLFGLVALWTHDVWRSRWDDFVGVGFWFVILVVSLDLKDRAPFDLRRALLRSAPFLVAVAMFFVLPFRIGAGTMLNVRLAVFVVLLVLPLVRARPALDRFVAPAACLLASASALTAAHELRAMEREELGGYSEALLAIRPGSRVLGLTFHRSARAKFSAWTHLVAHHRERGGGVAQVSYAELEHWPVRYRADRRPPTKADVFWEFHPCAFRNSIDGPAYDYLFSIGEIDPVANEPPGPRWRLVTRAGLFRVHARDGNRFVPPRDDPGPCPRDPTPRNEASASASGSTTSPTDGSSSAPATTPPEAGTPDAPASTPVRSAPPLP